MANPTGLSKIAEITITAFKTNPVRVSRRAGDFSTDALLTVNKNTIVNVNYLVPSYTLVAEYSVLEGLNLVVTLRTANVSIGTLVGYNISGVASTDIGIPLVGSFIIDSMGNSSITIPITRDYLTEGTETILLSLDNNLASLSCIIQDTSTAPPTYSLTSSADYIEEGQVVTISLTTTNIATNTPIAYLISGISSTDLVSGTLSGEMLLDSNGEASITLTITKDALTEGTELLHFSLQDIPNSSLTVIILDTSVTPVVSTDPLLKAPKYRYEHSRLFQPSPAGGYPSRVAGGSPYIEGRQHGPTAIFVDSLAGWTWERPGSDWIDADGVRHGPKPWAMHQAPAALPAPGVVVPVSLDITTLAQRDGWLAILLRCPRAPRVAITGGTGAPVLVCTYAGGTETVLPLITAAAGGSTTIPVVNADKTPFPIFIEFPRAKEGLLRAVLRFEYTDAQWGSYGGPAQYEVFPLAPPVNKDSVTLGIAASYLLDSGIEQAPGVLGAHRYEDGRLLSEFVSDLYVNTDDEGAFDPALYGRGPEDKSLLPHKDLGKWIMPGPDWQLVPSTWQGDNFEPFAPGLGALRIHMKSSGIKDGDFGGYVGSLAGNAKLYLPADRFGLQRTMFVRCGIRLTRGEGFIEGPAGRPHVFSAKNEPRWTEDGGKFFPMPSHNRTTGGVSGSAGGGQGWQTRLGWQANDAALGGPDENGWTMYGHFYDFGQANPPGHNYANDTREKTNFGQRGGLGAMLYYDQWYDIEAEITLNSVDRPAVLADGSPHIKGGVQQFWTPDGAWRVWVDGRLAFERTGLVFRSLPVANPGYRPGVGRPCRELGAEGIWMNWFHGGLTQNARPRTMFLSGLVWAEERIGPMTR